MREPTFLILTAQADADKRALEEAHCDPSVREPFIAALGMPGTTARPAAGPLGTFGTTDRGGRSALPRRIR
jgi:hypothetical protein